MLSCLLCVVSGVCLCESSVGRSTEKQRSRTPSEGWTMDMLSMIENGVIYMINNGVFALGLGAQSWGDHTGDQKLLLLDSPAKRNRNSGAAAGFEKINSRWGSDF